MFIWLLVNGHLKMLPEYLYSAHVLSTVKAMLIPLVIYAHFIRAHSTTRACLFVHVLSTCFVSIVLISQFSFLLKFTHLYFTKSEHWYDTVRLGYIKQTHYAFLCNLPMPHPFIFLFNCYNFLLLMWFPFFFLFVFWYHDSMEKNTSMTPRSSF